MKIKILMYLLAALFLFTFYSCTDKVAPVEEETLVIISGKVVEQKQNMILPVKDVQVNLTASGLTPMIDSTDQDGNYYFQFTLEPAVKLNVTMNIKKEGYKEELPFTFDVEVGSKYPIPPITITLDTTTTIGGGGIQPGSGMPQTIAFMGPQTIDIKVYGVGGNETAIILYEVRDSLGFPISISQRDTVTFAISGPPVAGGAYVSPSWAMTNSAGRVATTVNSGTISGVLQIVASLRRESDGVWVRSTPTRVVVNAGLPDQNYFSIGPKQYNFAAYNWIGRTNEILVQVGDKYSNPVHQGTAVYFNTTGGIVTAARYTDIKGQTTATLYSGNPLPNYAVPGFGPGYAWIYAQTIGQNGVIVKDSILILFSGVPGISVSPSYTINVPRGGSQTFSVNISDQHGNPLAPGTQISSTIEFSPPEGTNWAAKVGGLPDEPLNDYLFRGPGRTDFTLTVVDATPAGTPQIMPVVVKISVSGSNGNATAFLYGSVGN